MAFNLSKVVKTANRKQLSKSAERLVALLENARDLAVIHQQRQQASRVIKSAAEYAKSLRQEEIHDKLQVLSEAVKGKNNLELIEWFDCACRTVIGM